MRKISTWVAIILASLCIVVLVLGVRGKQSAYESARGFAVIGAARQSQAQMPPGHWLLIRRIPRP